MKTLSQTLRSRFVVAAAVALFAGCADEAPVAPEMQTISTRQTVVQTAAEETAIATLRRVTARYQDLATAMSEDFVLLHECEARPGEGPVGIVYVNIARLLDGVVDMESPDALIYEPVANGRPKLAGVEFAVPYALANQRPEFLGHSFQDEDEFGVYALHAWVWLNNPTGMFEETNPRISCGN